MVHEHREIYAEDENECKLHIRSIVRCIYVNDKDDLYFLITLNVQQSNFQYLINSVCEIIILV